MARPVLLRGGACCRLALAAGLAACGSSERGTLPLVSATDSEPPRPAAVEPAAPAEPAPASASVPAGLPDFSDPSWNQLQSRAGTYQVHWRSPAGKIPRNQDFELEVWVLRDGAPARDALLEVNAWMPDHGHGMLRRPRAEARRDGSFRVEGLLLHMRGHWQLFFEVLEGSLAETAEDSVDL